MGLVVETAGLGHRFLQPLALSGPLGTRWPGRSGRRGILGRLGENVVAVTDGESESATNDRIHTSRT